MRVLIISDDLTGALDTAAPFAGTGRRIVTALAPGHLDAALRLAPDILAINTASREIAAAEAQGRVALLAERLRPLAPQLVFKKIDSRLKGHVVAEVAAAMAGLRLAHAVVAPAIPDQGRFVRGGQVVGMGVVRPIPLPGFDGLAGIACPDIGDEAAMQAVARQILDSPSTLAVGARGLGRGIAQCLGTAPADLSAMRLPAPLIFAIGSRDPITLAQIGPLVAAGATVVDAPNGHVPATGAPAAPVLLIRCTESASHRESGAVVGRRFAGGVARIVAERQAGTLVASGGETAAAILADCGLGLLQPLGEVQPGLPLSAAHLPEGREMLVVTKSGGFGTPDSLVRLARQLAGAA